MREDGVRGSSPIAHRFYQYASPAFNTSPSGLSYSGNNSQNIVAIDPNSVNTVTCASCSNSISVILF